MISVSDNYAAFLDEPSRCPLYAVHITDEDTIDYRYVSGRLTNAADFIGAHEVLDPAEIRRKADPRESRYNASTLTFDLIDLFGVVTADITTGIEGLICTFYATGRLLDFDGGDAVILFKGIVDEVRYNGGRYRVIVRSAIARSIGTRVFDGVKTVLTEDLTDSETDIDVDSEGFQEAGAIVIGFERITYTGVTINGDGTSTLTGCTRGVGPSSPAAHTTGDTVWEIFAFGTPSALDHLYDDLQGFITNTGLKGGLGVDSSWIDSAGFAAAKTAVGETSNYDNSSFSETRGANAKKFMEEQFFRATASYPAENNLGQLRPITLDTPDPGDFVDTITGDDVIGTPSFKGSFENQVNHIIYKWSSDSINFTGEYEKQYQRSAPLRIEAYGRHTMLIECGGLRGVAGFTPATFLPERTTTIIDRFGDPIPLIEFNALLRKQLLEIGDPVYCTFQYVPDIADGDRSIDSGEFEIIGQTIDFRNGRIRFEVLGYPAS